MARDHSELNGTWTMLPAKSDFAGQPVVQTGTVTIQDRDGIIIVSRSFKYDGDTESFFYRDVTDAGHGETFHSGKDVKSKTNWDHDVLKVTTTESHAVTIETYSLAGDGTMVDTVVKPDHKPIVLVFQRN
jgi:lipopolysaccharide assembly outer membrane protein LptD (OstA)